MFNEKKKKEKNTNWDETYVSRSLLTLNTRETVRVRHGPANLLRNRPTRVKKCHNETSAVIREAIIFDYDGFS